MEEEILNKRRALATHRKEITKIQFLESYHHPSHSHPQHQTTHNNHHNHSPIERMTPQGNQLQHLFSDFPEKENLLFASSPPPSSSRDMDRDRDRGGYGMVQSNSYLHSEDSGASHGNGYQSFDENQIEEEIKSAKEIMKMARDASGRHRSSQRGGGGTGQRQNENFLKHEKNVFSKTIHRRDGGY
jgi:hypothetical protein